MKTKRKNKHHFQLLEVMIATFILTVCLAPTLRIFTNMYVSQQQIVRENQKSHLVHLAHAKVVEKLYKREIPMLDISGKKIHHIEDPDIKELLREAPFQISYDLSIEKGGQEVKDEENENKTGKKEKPVDYLCKLDIHVQELNSKREPCKEDTFDYYIYIDTRSDEEAGEKACEDENLETEVEDEDEEHRMRSEESETEDEDDEEYEFGDDDDEYEFDDDDDDDDDDFPYQSVAKGDRS